MKLRNKKTGEVVEVESCNSTTGTIGLFFAEGRECDMAYSSVAELNEEWEDYEEPKEHWTIGHDGAIFKLSEWENQKDHEEIGNYFETKEEAEKAVEKLRAWKRLKDKGFEIKGWTIDDGLRISIYTNFDSDGIYDDGKKQIKSDLDICFGGE